MTDMKSHIAKRDISICMIWSICKTCASFIRCLILKNYWIGLCFTFGKKTGLAALSKTYDSHACCFQPLLIQRNPSCMCQRSQFNNKGQTEGKKTFSSSPKVICMTCQCKQGLIHFSHLINKMHVWAGIVTRWCYRVQCTQRVLQMKRLEDDVHV